MSEYTESETFIFGTGKFTLLCVYPHVELVNYPGEMGTSAQLGKSLGIAFFRKVVNSLFYVYIHMWNYPGKMGTSAQLGNSLGIAFFRKVVNSLVYVHIHMWKYTRMSVDPHEDMCKILCKSAYRGNTHG